MTPPDPQRLARWRLVLGGYAEEELGQALPQASRERAMDRTLDFLYRREYQDRNLRGETAQPGRGQPTIPDWLQDVRRLFPQSTVETLERHALERYQLTELVTDPEVLRTLEPTYELLRMLLSFKHLMPEEVQQLARQVVKRVVDKLQQHLKGSVARVLSGRHSPLRPTRHRVAANLDWRRTLRANLKHWDPARERLVIQRLYFHSRVEQRLPWHVILLVDGSGSMLDSLIHSAIMAGILYRLPAVRLKLLVFDTEVVDLTDQVGDPADLLWQVQLGGGTNIAGALGAAEALVTHPGRTVMVLITDFYEGVSYQLLPAAIAGLVEAGVRVLGLAALDPDATPDYDRQMAEQCVAAGAEVAALTPDRLADWLSRIIA